MYNYLLVFDGIYEVFSTTAEFGTFKILVEEAKKTNNFTDEMIEELLKNLNYSVTIIPIDEKIEFIRKKDY